MQFDVVARGRRQESWRNGRDDMLTLHALTAQGERWRRSEQRKSHAVQEYGVVDSVQLEGRRDPSRRSRHASAYPIAVPTCRLRRCRVAMPSCRAPPCPSLGLTGFVPSSGKPKDDASIDLEVWRLPVLTPTTGLFLSLSPILPCRYHLGSTALRLLYSVQS